MRRFGLVAAAIVVTSGCGPFGCGPGASGAAPEASPLAKASLIIVDLSPSLSTAQHGGVGELILAHLKTLPTGSRFSVHALETQMGNGEALLSGTVPRSATILLKEEYDSTFAEWSGKLKEAVAGVVASETRRPLLTSCYLKSLNFATEYFGQRPEFTRQLVWIGDLIEDCHAVPEFYAVALPHEGLTKLDRLPTLPSLQATTLIGVLVPRSASDHAGQVDPDSVVDYWRRVAERLGGNPSQLTIGSPAVLGLEPTRQ